MAVSEVTAELEAWSRPAQAAAPARIGSNVWRFARKKPLGFVCGLMILLLVIVGDLVPETLNKAASVAGAEDPPVPYLADVMADNLGFVYPYDQIDVMHRLKGSSGDHLLGTDALGRDIFSRLLYGTRTAVMVAFGATLISAVLQVLINVPSGYYGGWFDKLAYRLVDVMDSLPTLVILLVVLGLSGSGLWQLIIAIGLISGLSGGRTLRGQTIQLMANPFIEGAKVVGASDRRIMMRYVIPNIMPLIILTATLRLGIIVLLEATLSFLGYGPPPPFPSWGQMLSLDGREFMRVQPGLAIYPGIAIGVLVFSFNLFGDALRDVLDPRLRGSR
jgi:peptide/nickel transport system permease protein